MIDREDSVRLEEENLALKDRLTSLRKVVRSMELRLKGYEWDTDGGKFTYTGDVLAGKAVIQKATGLLQPFCEEANLITRKSNETFSKQKYRVRTVFNNTLLAEGTSLAKNYAVIMQNFDDAIQNIGDIISGSRDLMKGNFASEDNYRKEKDY